MLDGYMWGDTHHSTLSQTDNDYDGRFTYVNDRANGRMARIDLNYFETDAIVDTPNQQGRLLAALGSVEYTYAILSLFRQRVLDRS